MRRLLRAPTALVALSLLAACNVLTTVSGAEGRDGEVPPTWDGGDGLDASTDAALADARDAELSDVPFPSDAPEPDGGPICAPDDEACNARDDDCDGDVDEGACSGCDALAYGGHAYLFCTSPRRTWSEARGHCTSVGYDLLILDDASEDAWVLAEIVAAESLRVDWWLGLSDQAEWNVYRWVDGTVLWRDGMAVVGLYQHFRGGEPDQNDEEECMEIPDKVLDGAWAEDGCEDSQPFVCESR